MSKHPRGNPDKEECLSILREIEDIIPLRGYARRVQEHFRENGSEEIPTMYQIQSVRNGRNYNLGVMKALREISKQHEEDQEEEKERKSALTRLELEKVEK